MKKNSLFVLLALLSFAFIRGVGSIISTMKMLRVRQALRQLTMTLAAQLALLLELQSMISLVLKERSVIVAIP
jgi:cell division protein FtsB